MKHMKPFALLLMAALLTLGGSLIAGADERQPLTKVLLSVGDVARELVRLDNEREEAESARDKARAELEAITKSTSKPNPGHRERAEHLRERIRHAEHRIRRLNRILGKIQPISFEATNDEELDQAQKLPQKLDEIFKKVTGLQMGNKFRVEPTFNPLDKTGGIKIQWRGNP